MVLPLLMGICACSSVIVLITMDYKFDRKMEECLMLYRCKLKQKNYSPPIVATNSRTVLSNNVHPKGIKV